MLGDTRAYLFSPVWGSYSEPKGNSSIPTKVILDRLKRNMSRGNSLSDELDLGSVLGDTELICIVPFWGSYSEPNGNSS